MPELVGLYALVWLLAVVGAGAIVAGAVGTLVVHLFRRVRSGEVRSRVDG